MMIPDKQMTVIFKSHVKMGIIQKTLILAQQRYTVEPIYEKEEKLLKKILQTFGVFWKHIIL